MEEGSSSDLRSESNLNLSIDRRSTFAQSLPEPLRYTVKYRIQEVDVVSLPIH